MFFIPIWITNFLFLITCWLSGFQMVKLKRPNPITNIQFLMILFCLPMVLVVALYNRTNPWLSCVFFVISVVTFGIMIHQHRTLPPDRITE